MVSELVEGQTLSPHFTLVNKIAEAGDEESWLAINDVTNERIFLKILGKHLETAEWEKITANIDNVNIKQWKPILAPRC